MTEQNEKTNGKKKKLSLSRPGKLELNKTVDAGQVRQSFSHGRTKAVAVEVRRKRTFKQADDGAMTEIREQEQVEEAGPVLEKPVEEAPTKKLEAPARTLTDQERAARTRALEGARQTETEIAESRAEREAMESRRREEDARQREQEEQRRKDEDHRRRAEEEERRRLDEEAARRAAEQAARLETPDPAAADTAKPKAKAKTKIDTRAPAAEEQADRAGKLDTRKPAARRGDSRRRSGKLTISQALNDEERQRSLASVRRQREREKRAAAGPKESKKVFREVIIPDNITVQELANRMAERAGDIIKALMNNGIMATITETIDADTAELVVTEFGHTPKRVSEADVELGLKRNSDEEDIHLQPRPPVVTIMGHVDHGKTSLLDALRSTDVVAGEAGGITQHIGAYQVRMASGDKITFLDTPGHEAFTAMRSRGASSTDIVVLVVAADDGIMPQTVEAIDHAKAADVPIIIAINKMDRPDADPDRVRSELLSHELVVENLGGDILSVEVSAVQKTNLDKLEEAIILQSEILEIQANPDREAEGVIVEAKIETGRGSVATVLVQSGTLNVGDIVVAGAEWGKVRALIDDTGSRVKTAAPSMPVEILGLNGTPDAGDEFGVVENEARAREITEFRQRRNRDAKVQAGARGTLDQMFDKIQAGKAKEIPIVVKGDVQGSLEAIIQSANNLGTDEVSVRVLHSGVGAINESDVTLAQASGAMLVGFNVRANSQARQLAASEGADIRYYAIIYDLVDDLKSMLSGLLAPQIRETFLGNAAIKEVFNITKIGRVAGCEVTEGVVRRGSSVRLLRDDIVIHEGKLSTLKRFKDEVREVTQGFECGMAFESYQDLKAGDVIECFDVEEIARTL